MCINPVYKWLPERKMFSPFPFPCGGCMSCRLDNLLLWQARINSEWLKYRSSFVTFTYDDNHLQYGVHNAIMPTLKKEDLSKYLDNVRHKIKRVFQENKNLDRQTPNYKYFAVGEYGDNFKRPHYHILYMGIDAFQFQQIFRDSWKNGSVKALPLLPGGVRYVVDYMTKRETGELAKTLYEDTYREKPFILSSPGIGQDFFVQHKDEISKTGFVKIGNKLIPVPTHYYNKLAKFTVSDMVNLNNLRQQYEKQKISELLTMFKSKDFVKLLDSQKLAKEQSLVQSARLHGKPFVDDSYLINFSKEFQLRYSDLHQYDDLIIQAMEA